MTMISESRWAELLEVRWSSAETREVLAACSASGMSIRRFALEHGLNVQRLYWWRQRLGELAPYSPSDQVPAFVPIELRSDEVRRETALVHLDGGVVLEVPLAASPEWVGAVARSLTED